ncbi:FAD-dependent oxidoreductase [Kocuria sp. U4B]
MRAIICGAGIAGLSCALQLHRQGWAVTVVESAAGPRAEGYMLDFFGPGYAAAEAMGILPRLRELSHPISELVYVDDHGRRRAGAGYARFARALDGRLMSLMRPDLELALREQVAGSVDLRFGCTVDRIDDGPGSVRGVLDDGTVLEADLLVGADGIHSRARSLVFGPEEQYIRLLGLHTAAFTFTDPHLPALLGDRLHLTDTVDRMMGLYALRDGRTAVFTVHRTPEAARPDDARAALRTAFAGLGWLVPTALDRCPPSGGMYYDVVAQVEVPRWSAGHVVLAGDACQAVSLVAGQGASLAVAGASVLAAQLASAPTVPDGLSAYERRWRPVVAERQRAGRSGVEWFLPSSSATLRKRHAALRLLALPGLNRALAGSLLGRTRVPAAGPGPDPMDAVNGAEALRWRRGTN